MERGMRGGRDLSESIDRCYTLQSKKLMETVDQDQRHTTAVVSLTGGRMRQHCPRKRRVKSEISPTTRNVITTANATGVAQGAVAAAADEDDDVTMHKRRMRDDDDANDAGAGIGRVERRPNGHKRIRSDTLRDAMFEVSELARLLQKMESASSSQMCETYIIQGLPTLGDSHIRRSGQDQDDKPQKARSHSAHDYRSGAEQSRQLQVSLLG